MNRLIRLALTSSIGNTDVESNEATEGRLEHSGTYLMIEHSRRDGAHPRSYVSSDCTAFTGF